MNNVNKSNATYVFSAVAVVLVVALVAIIATSFSNDSSDSVSNTQSNTVLRQYTDGTYSAEGDYISPGGRESIELSVTLKEGKVVDTSVQPKATSSEGKEYQSRFADNYKENVVGKPIDEVSLTRVAGSSLTSVGFNEALEQIKNDAAA